MYSHSILRVASVIRLGVPARTARVIARPPRPGDRHGPLRQLAAWRWLQVLLRRHRRKAGQRRRRRWRPSPAIRPEGDGPIDKLVGSRRTAGWWRTGRRGATRRRVQRRHRARRRLRHHRRRRCGLRRRCRARCSSLDFERDSERGHGLLGRRVGLRIGGGRDRESLRSLRAAAWSCRLLGVGGGPCG